MLRMQRLAWVGAALAALATGCSEGGESFVIVQNQVPDEGCIIPPDPGTFRSRGRIDVNAQAGYLFTPVAQSLVAESATGMADRIIFIRGADVELEFQEGLFDAAELADMEAMGLSRFRQPISGSIFPEGTTSFGFEVIPQPTLDRIAAAIGPGGTTQVVAEVVMFGALDGGDVESEPFFYPIEVCDGCLLVDVGPCDALPDGYEPTLTGGECQPLQDAPAECCTFGDGDLLCPAAAIPAT